MARPVVLVRHPACFVHDTGPGHPEAPARLAGILDAVRGDAALGRDVLVEVEAQPAEVEDLLLVHSPAHVALVHELSERAARQGSIDWIDPDTAVSGLSFLAAVSAAGCAVTAAELVATGHARAAFALARPPGHHAAYDRAAGFCLFNNVMIAARRLQKLGLARRVLVVDWDVHHGNGTQALAWGDPTTCYLSLHLYPHYPGTGAASERGGGLAQGGVRNVPLPPGTDAAEYRRRFSRALEESVEDFDPDLVLVSAGFDCLAGDPLGGLLLEPEDLHALTTEIVARTSASAEGRVVAVLEGGYVPDRIGLGAVNVLRALAALPALPTGAGRELHPPATPGAS
jgi:acetoin utilization deacetylase AcuC-like enzyme